MLDQIPFSDLQLRVDSNSILLRNHGYNCAIVKATLNQHVTSISFPKCIYSVFTNFSATTVQSSKESEYLYYTLGTISNKMQLKRHCVQTNKIHLASILSVRKFPVDYLAFWNVSSCLRSALMPSAKHKSKFLIETKDFVNTDF